MKWISRIVAASWLMASWRFFEFWQLWGNNSGSVLVIVFSPLEGYQSSQKDYQSDWTIDKRSDNYFHHLFDFGPTVLSSVVLMALQLPCHAVDDAFLIQNQRTGWSKQRVVFELKFIVYIFHPEGWFAAFPRWARRRTMSRQRQRTWCFDMSWLWLLFWLMFSKLFFLWGHICF